MTKTVTYSFYSKKIDIINKYDVWELTAHGQAFGNGMFNKRQEFFNKRVIEIGTGSGVHAILAILLGAKSIDVTDIDSRSLALAKENAKLNNVKLGASYKKDWLTFAPEKVYDIVICNPPFCMAPNGNRRFFIQELISNCHVFFENEGILFFTQSSMANFKLTEKELIQAGFSFDIVYQSEQKFRDYYYTELGFMEEISLVKNGFTIRNGEHFETLKTYFCKFNKEV